MTSETIKIVEVAEHYAKLKDVQVLRILRITLKRGPKATPEQFEGVHLKQDGNNEDIWLVGKRPAWTLKGNHVFHLPADPREWYLSAYNPPDEEIKPEYQQYNPFGHMFSLAAWEHQRDGRIDKFRRKPYDRYDVGLEELIGGISWTEVKRPKPDVIYPWPEPPRKAKHYGLTKVHVLGQQPQYYQYDYRTALCAAYAQSKHIFTMDRVKAFDGGLQFQMNSTYRIGEFHTNQIDDTGPSIRRDTAAYQEITFAEMLSLMDEEVHEKVIGFMQHPGTIGFVLFENHMMDSSALGQRSILPIGPNWTIKDLDSVPDWINDLPSQRQQKQYFCKTTPSGAPPA